MPNGQTPSPTPQQQPPSIQQPPLTIVHVPVILEMFTCSREQIEGLIEGGVTIASTMLGISVGIMTTAWVTIFSVDLAGKTFFGFMATALVSTLSTIYYALKTKNEWSATQRKINRLFGKKLP